VLQILGVAGVAIVGFRRFVWAACFGAACVPPGSSSSSASKNDGGMAVRANVPSSRPSEPVMLAPFIDTFERSRRGHGEGLRDGGESLVPARDAGTPATFRAQPDAARALERDGGDPSAAATVMTPPDDSLGPDWHSTKMGAWFIENGRLCGQSARNHPVWLKRTLPVNARIEFDATSYSDDGDVKVEVWGDGVSFATGTSYSNATSYLAILGGWKNSLHVLARLDEHGADRKVIQVDPFSDDMRQQAVRKGQTYRIVIERNDAKTVRWSVDGAELAAWPDPAPLLGPGHDHFGLNTWEAKVCFDNLRVSPL